MFLFILFILFWMRKPFFDLFFLILIHSSLESCCSTKQKWDFLGCHWTNCYRSWYALGFSSFSLLSLFFSFFINMMKKLTTLLKTNGAENLMKVTNPSGKTILHLACERGVYQVSFFFYNKDSQYFFVSCLFSFLLITLSFLFFSLPQIIHVLLKKGANTNQKTKTGVTPFYSFICHFKVSIFLLIWNHVIDDEDLTFFC